MVGGAPAILQRSRRVRWSSNNGADDLLRFLSEPLVGEAIGIPDPPIFMLLGIVAYGIAANVCYTGGWIVETNLARRGAQYRDGFRLRAFRRGATQ